MKDKSKVILIAVILIVVAVIAYVCYGITKGNKNPLVTMDVSYVDSEGNQKTGTVKIELYPDVAPESVANFIALANNEYYDGLTFHRIVDNFVVQGGDKEGTGAGSAKLSDINKSIAVDSSDDYTYSIKGEFAANGVNNNLKFEKGVIGMARSDYSSYGLTEEGYNSASSQFFIVSTDDKSALNSLNQNYAPFGRVIEGYEFVEEIAKLYAESESSENQESAVSSEENQSETASEESSEENAEEKNVPKTTKIRVDTFGANYGLPNAINYQKTLDTVSQYQNYYNQLMSSYSADSSTDAVSAE